MRYSKNAEAPTPSAVHNSDQTETSSEKNRSRTPSETWAADAQADLEDFIESQGVYIRQ